MNSGTYRHRKILWHYLSFERALRFYFSDCRRYRSANRLKDLAANPTGLRPYRQFHPVFFHGHFLEGFEILLDLVPFKVLAGVV